MMISILIAAFTASSECPSQLPIPVTQDDGTEISFHMDMFSSGLVTSWDASREAGETPENAWEYFDYLARNSEDERVTCLYELVAQDQIMRLTVLDISQRAESEDGLDELHNQLGQLFRAIDARNREWLRGQIDEHGWFTIGEYGQEADQAAFLIVQHADHDLGFQINMLEMLAGYAADYQTDPRNYAYVSDRVAVNSGQPQSYGTQGWCTGPGSWEPREFVGTLEEVEERRLEIGMWPIASYIESNARNCVSDQRY